MPFKDLFRKPQRYITVHSDAVTQERGTLWIKCPECGEILYARELAKNLNVCRKCSHHFRLSAPERLAITLDEDSFQELDTDLDTADPLSFPEYEDKLARARETTGLQDAILTGEGTIMGWPVLVGVFEPHLSWEAWGALSGKR